MSEFNQRHSLNVTPPRAILPVLDKTKTIYKYWQKVSNSFPKPFRFGLGARIENLFIDILELQFLATFSKPTEKEIILRKTITKFDLLKFLIQISWENHYLTEKRYSFVSKELDIIGKELAGWKKFIENKNSHTNAGEI